jgi:hypothetical protein
VRTVVVGGRVVLRDRTMTTLDTGEVLLRARALAERMAPAGR